MAGQCEATEPATKAPRLGGEPSEQPLKGRVALIVGAGQQAGATLGNGRATALVFAREGAKVCCVDRDLASCEETAEQCRAYGVEALALQADVASEASVEAMVKGCVERFTTIDILHNNVGIADGDTADITEMSLEIFERITRVNMTGMLLVCKHVVPVMRKQRSGNIINISSIGSVLTLPSGGGGGFAYKMSKAAVNTLTTNLAMENASHGIRVNCILPGLMDTPLSIERRAKALCEKEGLDMEEARGRVRKARNAQVPLHGPDGPAMGSAMDTAEAACFLAVDGGQCVVTGCLPGTA
eukprot:CAMPEP_0171276786 /NCGR_PEP_ID=MMETSP0790-20130122/64020_1 /TAXON_ID=2925 /ORGANISM="Alexandrium catenella, Strain OF101" /LENGTH=298 /DNA_ID=CAMNT_0011745897 /DNA_START=47 /DNA_END=943 /DNA_ORIENTATION=+